MSAGRLIAVVGPSGVGKDSLMTGIHAADPRYHLVRRAITRVQDAGGENHLSMTPEDFALAAARRAFCLSWSAHGLHYGIPAGVLDSVRGGTDCIVNLSRGALADAAQIFSDLVVLHVTASVDVLERRLIRRGRESPMEIEKRLCQASPVLPAALTVIDIRNDGPLQDSVGLALHALRRVEA
jgi:ribose 1,5-bisphosphokinase